MKAVGVRELKNRLSEYLRLVRAGEQILVTDRGEIIAELRRPGSAAASAPYPKLIELASQGRVRLSTPGRGWRYRRLSMIVAEGEAQRLLDETRAER